MWYGKGVDDFNRSIQLIISDSDRPKVRADLSNGFTSEYRLLAILMCVLMWSTVLWVAYAFYGVPVIVAMSKMQVKATK